MIRWFRRIIALLVLVYLGYALAMIWLHPRFIYPFSQEPFAGDGYTMIEIAVPGTDPLPLWVHRGNETAPVVLYFMGNRGTLELFRPMLDHHKRQGRGVVGMTYRGGGGVPGEPSERALKRDAMAALQAVHQQFPERSLIVQGYSLGTGVAMHVAANAEVDAVILSAPYTRLCTLMAKASGLPACFMPIQRWDSLADANRVREAVLIVHGSADQLIPIWHGRRLARTLSDAGAQTTFLPIDGAGHTNLTQFPNYLQQIDAFLTR